MRQKTKKIPKHPDIGELSWVKRGKQRREIIIHLHGVQTPTDISKESNYSLNHISRILREFKEHKFVKLLNPKQKTGRLYELTTKGRLIRDKVKREKD